MRNYEKLQIDKRKNDSTFCVLNFVNFCNFFSFSKIDKYNLQNDWFLLVLDKSFIIRATVLLLQPTAIADHSSLLHQFLSRIGSIESVLHRRYNFFDINLLPFNQNILRAQNISFLTKTFEKFKKILKIKKKSENFKFQNFRNFVLEKMSF